MRNRFLIFITFLLKNVKFKSFSMIKFGPEMDILSFVNSMYKFTIYFIDPTKYF